MRKEERRALERALRAHYGAERCIEAPRPSPAFVRVLAAEMARARRPSPAAVVAEQVRWIGATRWVMHLAIALAAVFAPPAVAETGVVAGCAGAALAAASLTGLTRSRSCGMAELEAACAVNAPAAALARAVALGCVDALAMFAFALLAGREGTLWTTLAQACVPYLVATGVGLLAARRAAAPDATVAAAAASVAVLGFCAALRLVCPAAFAPASTLVWWAAACASAAFAVRELRAWLRSADSAFVAEGAAGAAAGM